MEYAKQINFTRFKFIEINEQEEIPTDFYLVKEVGEPSKEKYQDSWYEMTFDESNQQWIQTWYSAINRQKIQDDINPLKQQLSATDYKVIKNMEAQMLGLDLPYNPTELNFERQPLRDKINELEKLLEDRGVVAQ